MIPSGNVVPCMSLDYIEMTDGFPNIYEMPLKQILSDSSFTEAMTKRVSHVLDHSQECSDCEYRSKCCGGCRAIGLALTGDVFGCDQSKCLFYEGGYTEKLQNALPCYHLNVST